MNRKIIGILGVVIAIILTVSVGTFFFLNSAPSAPVLTVTFSGTTTDQQSDTTVYDFDIKVTVPSSSNYPFGESAAIPAINNALKPLLDKHDLITGTYDGVTTANWSNQYIVNGESTFRLMSHGTFSDTQIAALTTDLYNALTVAMKG